MDITPKIDQISVFLENRAGQLAEVIAVLADAGINIKGLSLADTSDFGILRLIVCKKEKAIESLQDKGFTTGRTSVLAVALKNESGALNELLKQVSKSSINVEYMYGGVSDYPEKAVMIFRFDKIDEAIRLLQKQNFELLPASVLCSTNVQEK